MLKKTILCGALALTTVVPFATNIVHSASNSSLEKAITDTAITAKVKALYSKSPVINQSKVSVSTINHKVFLSGQVKTNTQYERAIILAESVNGVKYVNADNLTVKSNKGPLKDSYTTAKVKGRILKEKLFGTQAVEYWPVIVETKDSVVYLSGTVGSKAKRAHLVKLAREVKGVNSVNSAIIVKQ